MRQDKQFLFQFRNVTWFLSFPCRRTYTIRSSALPSPGTLHPKYVHLRPKSWKSDVLQGLGERWSIGCEEQAPSSSMLQAGKGLRLQFLQKGKDFCSVAFTVFTEHLFCSGSRDSFVFALRCRWSATVGLEWLEKTNWLFKKSFIWIEGTYTMKRNNKLAQINISTG